jgi:GNAT superfamily N-acetyltransferase
MSAKEREVLNRINDVEIKTNDNVITAKGNYLTPDNKTVELTLFAVKGSPMTQNEIAYRSLSAGWTADYAKPNLTKLNIQATYQGRGIGDLDTKEMRNNSGSLNENFGIPTGYSEIQAAWVAEDFRRLGIASAMLAFARKVSPIPVEHSTSLSDDGRAFSVTTKHQAGQHDQSTHGSWATANGYKLASEEDLPALQSQNYDSTVNDALYNYTTRGYTWMNSYLRDGYIEDKVLVTSYHGPSGGYVDKKEAIGLIDSLKSSLYEIQTTQDLTVTRWTRTGESILGEKISDVSNLENLIGKTYHAKGFTSTSAKPDKNVNDSYRAQSKVLVNIHMPAGTYGATVGNARESEFLLPPDTFFVVMGASDIGEGRISLDLLVTGQGDG